MFRTFGRVTNQSHLCSFLCGSDLISFFLQLYSTVCVLFLTVCVFWRYVPSRIGLFYKPKKVRTPCMISVKNKHLPAFCFYSSVLKVQNTWCSTFDTKKCEPNHFDIPMWKGADVSNFCPIHLWTGTLSSDKCFLQAGWSVRVKWFELMLFQEKSMHFF